MSKDDTAAAVPAWQRAVGHVQQGSQGPPLDRSLRVSVHFHPDRRVGDRSLLSVLVTEQVYRSQFVTGSSNGGLTAHPGGDRWWWEERLFRGAYGAAASTGRPRYGSLNHRRRDEGGSISFR